MTPDHLFGLSGKIAVITGGGTGVGRMAATGLAAAGARVFITSRKVDVCETTAAEINDLKLAGRVESFVGDLSSEGSINILVDEIKSRTGQLDILINNAGRTWGEAFGTFPYQAWDKVMSLNVAGMFHLTQGLIGLLTASGSSQNPSRVINVGSVMGEIPMGDGAYSYAVSKSAVHHMTRILAKELADRNITVNALALGPFRSGMTKFAIGDEKGSDRVSTRIPAQRIGQPEDIAASILFLCGYGGSYITGAILPISGGLNIATGPSIFGDDGR